MHLLKYDLRTGTGFPQSTSGLYPVEFRHRNVDDTRLQFSGSFDQRFNVLHTPDRVESGLQEISS